MYLKLQAFIKTVSSAGKRVRLTDSDIRVSSVSIVAERSNTGYIYVGNDQVSSTNYGAELTSYDSYNISSEESGWANLPISLKDIWIDSSVDADGVSVSCLEVVE